MDLPFTIEEFLNVFAAYNLAVWPIQFVLFGLGLLGVAFALKKKNAGRLVSGILAFLWIWTGLAYHLAQFTRINPGAYVFGAAFVVQGLLFLFEGVIRNRLSFAYSARPSAVFGAVLMAYAMLVYPLLNLTLGHSYPHMPTFGLPCPTTIFTFGILLWTVDSVPKHLLVLPLLWSLLGASAAVSLGIWEDLGLAVAGLGGTTGIVLRDKRLAKLTRFAPSA